MQIRVGIEGQRDGKGRVTVGTRCVLVHVLVHECKCDNVHYCMDTCMCSSTHSCGCVIDGRDAMVAF